MPHHVGLNLGPQKQTTDKKVHKNVNIWGSKMIFCDILKQNNDYSDTLDFSRGSVGKVEVISFFCSSKTKLLICVPNACMCGWDCKHALHCLQMVRIQFATNHNLSVFLGEHKSLVHIGENKGENKEISKENGKWSEPRWRFSVENES